MQMFPDPDLAEVLRRDRHHQLAARRGLDGAVPRRRGARAISARTLLARRLGR